MSAGEYDPNDTAAVILTVDDWALVCASLQSVHKKATLVLATRIERQVIRAGQVS